MPDWTSSTCVRGGAAIPQPATGRPRRFCSDACRKTTWRATKGNRKGYTGRTAPEGQNIHALCAAFSPGTAAKPDGEVATP